MTRKKIIETSIKTMDEVDAILCEIGTLEAQKRDVENWVTREESKIREVAKKKLMLKSGESVNDRIVSLSGNLLAYITTKKDYFVNNKRSRDMLHGTIGFRLGQPKVDVIGKITQKAIITTEALVKKLKLWGFIDEKPRLDKTAILEAYKKDKDKTLQKLRKVSLTVTQEDEPWFDTRRMEIETVMEPEAEQVN